MGRLDGNASIQSVRAIEHVEQRPARHLPLPSDMDGRLVNALARRTPPIHQLYKHQRESWDAVARGEDVVVVTPTASGKTLCFNLPVIDRALRTPLARALYLYPTKALANDQLAALQELLSTIPDPPRAAVFHGDLTAEQRAPIKANPPNILIATPDILHHQHLPKHVEWASLWRNLHFVVIDEAHAYRGVFGSHIGHVLRRVRRIAAHYGSSPTFIAASATIGNPVEHIEALTGRRPTLIDESGAPEPGRDLVVWDPLILDGYSEAVAHASSEREAARLFVATVLAGHSVIAFARSRRAVDRIYRRARKSIERVGRKDLAGKLSVYRAGLTPERRREIERGLRAGTTVGVVATTALELGVDIGSLEVAILASYPGSTMGFRQQAGRAGRRERDALVVMIASQNPLDQYLAEHPRLLFGAPPEHAVTDIANDSIARGQLGCAARERPLADRDVGLFGGWLPGAAQDLITDQILAFRLGEYAPGVHAPKPGDVNLRSMEGRSYELLDGYRHLGEMERRYIARDAHPNAVYLHDGEAYRVDSIDHRDRKIHLRVSDEGVLTNPRGERYVDLLESRRQRALQDSMVTVTLGRVRSTTVYRFFDEVDEETGRIRSRGHPIEPPQRMELDTVGLQLLASERVDPAALHALEHLLRALAPLIVLCDRADLDGHTEVEGALAAYVFDNHPRGVGLAERIFDAHDEVLEAVAQRVSECRCRDGCPGCIFAGMCLLDNEPLDKEAVIELLAALGFHAERPRARPRPVESWAVVDEVAPPALDEQLRCPRCGRGFRTQNGRDWHIVNFKSCA